MLMTSIFVLWGLGFCLIVPAIILGVLMVTLRRNNPASLPIFSLVTGILGFIPLPITGSIAAIVSGNIALNAYRSGALTGDTENMARAGVILGWIGLALWIIGTLGVFLFFYPITSVSSGG
jgi:hypothetical protein